MSARVGHRFLSLLTKSNDILQQDGLLALIRKIASRMSHFIIDHRSYCVFAKDLRDHVSVVSPPIDNIELQITRNLDEVERLKSQGYDFSAYPQSDEMRKGFTDGGILLFIFVNKDLAHSSWFATDIRGVTFDPVFQNTKYNDATYIGPCNTYGEYRGKGLYPYALSTICTLLKAQGKSRTVINTRNSNIPSIRGIKKAGFILIAEVHRRQVLSLTFWQEKKLSHIDNEHQENFMV